MSIRCDRLPAKMSQGQEGRRSVDNTNLNVQHWNMRFQNLEPGSYDRFPQQESVYADQIRYSVIRKAEEEAAIALSKLLIEKFSYPDRPENKNSK